MLISRDGFFCGAGQRNRRFLGLASVGLGGWWIGLLVGWLHPQNQASLGPRAASGFGSMAGRVAGKA